MRYSEPMEPELDRLIARCLKGDGAAWDRMFEHYQPHLLAHVLYLLRGEGGVELAEEMAAAVWCSLCSDSFMRLRRYDPALGGFLRYLGLLARGEIWRRKRADRSRASRESHAARKESTVPECERGLVIQEFLDTLTPCEREFCIAYLLNEFEPSSRRNLSAANGWKLRSRVFKKFRTYCGEDS